MYMIHPKYGKLIERRMTIYDKQVLLESCQSTLEKMRLAAKTKEYPAI